MIALLQVKMLISMTAVLMLFIGCHASKPTTQTKNMEPVPVNPDMKGILLDGAWEANYIMNAPKPVAELFPHGSPTITFSSVNGSVTGMAGCNNFNGTYSAEGRVLKIGDNIAVTRKMCPDMSGEQVFLETLKKVNAYSVTEQGKTLNLIMGDIAVMRLSRKEMQ